MRYYILRRLVMMTIVLLMVTIITFLLTTIAPSDPAAQWAGTRPTPKQLETARKELGLDKPVYLRYLLYIQNMARGELGTSIRTRQPVVRDLFGYFPATFELVTLAIIISLLIGIPLGILSAVRRESTLDHLGRLFSLSGVGVPIFWLGMMLQLFAYAVLKTFPIQGRIASEISFSHPVAFKTGLFLIDTLVAGNWTALKSTMVHIILPATTLSFASLAFVTRMARSSMIEVLREDYVRTAKAFGVNEYLIRYKYALKNALVPTVTVVGLAYGSLLGGSVLVESIFDWPGIGRYVWLSILYNDFPAIMGVTIVFAITYLLINLCVDLIYAFIDPRVRYTRG
jgi:peptide/nickel transport system permease protein